MTISEKHTMWGEAFGIFCWLWVFHRARYDLPVVLGWRHPWDHAEDPFSPHVQPLSPEKNTAREEGWDVVSSKTVNYKDDDEDDDDDE
jgi:hypothetical protein